MPDQDTRLLPTRPTEPGRVYAAPRLVVYGSLGDITRAIGTTKNIDGGKTAGMKHSKP